VWPRRRPLWSRRLVQRRRRVPPLHGRRHLVQFRRPHLRWLGQLCSARRRNVRWRSHDDRSQRHHARLHAVPVRHQRILPHPVHLGRGLRRPQHLRHEPAMRCARSGQRRLRLQRRPRPTRGVRLVRPRVGLGGLRAARRMEAPARAKEWARGPWNAPSVSLPIARLRGAAGRRCLCSCTGPRPARACPRAAAAVGITRDAFGTTTNLRRRRSFVAPSTARNHTYPGFCCGKARGTSPA